MKQLYPGRDGRVRSVELELPSGNTSRRAIQTLYPVELREDVPECLPALEYPPVEGEKDDDEQFEDVSFQRYSKKSSQEVASRKRVRNDRGRPTR